jgi:hypothetical protein
MGKYGSTAVRSVARLRGSHESADEAWRAIAEHTFEGAPESRDKACPRQAFLGLCAAGLIRGVSPGTCTETSRSPNRSYSVTAVRLLVADPSLAQGSKIGLWRRVLRGLGADPKKKPNEQMDVVLALWEQGLIVIPAISQAGATA